MKLENRDYQANAIRKLPGLLLLHQRILMVSPTASGKTVIAAAVLRAMIGKRVLWLAHRKELLLQARTELKRAGIPADWIRLFTGSEKVGDESALITIASIDMFAAARNEVPEADLVVIDEAHRAAAKTYRMVQRKLPKAMVLGLTATPWRLDGKGLDDSFDHMFVVATMTELIGRKFIAAPMTYGVPREKAREIVRGVRSLRGDYDRAELERSMLKGTLMGDIVAEWERLALGKPTIVFAVTRRYGRELAWRFAERDHSVGYLDAETSEQERERLTGALRAGTLTILVNVDVLVEGVDLPRVKCIVMARPTKSLTRFLQQAGRAGRWWRGQRPIILDHAGNWTRFGLPQEEHPWSLEGRGHGDGEPPKGRHCPVCQRVNAWSAKTCEGCGADLPKSDREITEEKARLERLQLDEDELAHKKRILASVQRANGFDEKWLERALREAS